MDGLIDPKLAELVRSILAGEFSTKTAAGAALGMSRSDVSKALRKAYAAGITTKADIDAAMAAAKRSAEDGEAH